MITCFSHIVNSHCVMIVSTESRSQGSGGRLTLKREKATKLLMIISLKDNLTLVILWSKIIKINIMAFFYKQIRID